MKVVMLDGNALVGHNYKLEEEIFKKNNIDFEVLNCKTEEEIIEKSKDADGVMTVFCKLNKNVISHLKKCKVFVRYGVGYDVIDVEEATKANIAVCNLPDYCIEDVAVHAITLILNSLRKVTIYNSSVHRGEWNNGYGYLVHRPSNITLGLLGFGNIARHTARYAKAFGMNIVAYDPYLSKEFFDKFEVSQVSLDELFKISDVISVHAPLTKETLHIINKENISKMKDNVIIVNTSRGPLINFYDLFEAVKSKKILAAGLDVMEREPLSGNDVDILKYENVTITPHCGFNSIESTNEMHKEAAISACKVLLGEFPKNVINKTSLKK